MIKSAQQKQFYHLLSIALIIRIVNPKGSTKSLLTIKYGNTSQPIRK